MSCLSRVSTVAVDCSLQPLLSTPKARAALTGEGSLGICVGAPAAPRHSSHSLVDGVPL